jgi:hypothetical protein
LSYYVSCGGFGDPIKPYDNLLNFSRRVLTNIVLCGIGKDVTVTKQTADNHEHIHITIGVE